MKSLGFDPGASVLFEGSYELAEVSLDQGDDGRYYLTAYRDGGGERIAAMELRADFLAEVVAQARAGEQSAA